MTVKANPIKTTLWVITVGMILLISLHAVFRTTEQTNHTTASESLVRTGKHLFFDNRLSFNQTKSCASCHDPAFAFSDGYRRSVTATGDRTLHNAPSLINVDMLRALNWASPDINGLEEQHQRALFAEHPVEMGAAGNEMAILNNLKQDSLYKLIFKSAFPDESDPVNFKNITKSIAAYVSTLRSLKAPYDDFIKGDSLALTPSARKGMALFYSARLRCVSCHVPPYFTAAAVTGVKDSVYFNTGLYNVGGTNTYPVQDNGIRLQTSHAADDGKFRIPSLRNVSRTAPYMHDGSISTLDEVIDTYAAGGRNLTKGPFRGDGRTNNQKDSRIAGFSLTATEKSNLLDFFYSLTDSTIFINPHFAKPEAKN